MCRYCLPNNNIKEKSNLFWKNYSDHVIEFLHKIRQSNNFTDVTLVCDDKRQLKAHKVVLSACSPVFQKIVNDGSALFVTGVEYEVMESILDFMYTGVLNCSHEKKNEFLNVAKNLEIKGIQEDVKLDENNVSESNEVLLDEDEVVSDDVSIIDDEERTKSKLNMSLNGNEFK